MKKTKKVVVFSGGQDSTTCLFMEKAAGHDLIAVTYNYGQRHKVECEAAKIIAKIAGIPHEVINFPEVLRGGTLLDGGDLHTYKDYQTMVEEVGDSVENTYVPVRNMVFLSLAANYALSKGIDFIVTGVCGSDTANYPDCSLKFIKKAEKALSAAYGNKFFISAPLAKFSKKEIVRKAWKLGRQCWDALSYSHTAYSGKFPPTTKDHSTLLREEGFRLAGLPDPMIVRAHKELGYALPKEDNYSDLLVKETINILSDRMPHI
ncbi:MAG: 7-cyano-7-deazaguanine synthase QueC [Fibromonadaceae bacterium]|jgi:7-cyano-7-deazaguanine synthase|nr:7-cyano-7-deazaguanine synthase QueC [Fibromonadaceae bacterium]